MKICAAQIHPIKGDIKNNVNKHLKLIELAATKEAHSTASPRKSSIDSAKTGGEDGSLDAAVMSNNFKKRLTVSILHLPNKTSDGVGYGTYIPFVHATGDSKWLYQAKIYMLYHTLYVMQLSERDINRALNQYSEQNHFPFSHTFVN